MTTPLTAERIAELREIAEKAHWGGCVCVFCHTWRRTFDMATVKLLLDEIERLKRGDFTPEEFRPCDYRKSECAVDGKIVDGVWRCNNHLSTTRPASAIGGAGDFIGDD